MLDSEMVTPDRGGVKGSNVVIFEYVLWKGSRIWTYENYMYKEGYFAVNLIVFISISLRSNYSGDRSNAVPGFGTRINQEDEQNLLSIALNM